MWAWSLNTAWMVWCAAERARFARAARRVRQTQAEVLRQILAANLDCWFGRHYAFARIDNPVAFQKRVPAMTYEDYAPFIARIAAGEAQVLTREPVLLLEPTSGTTCGEKLIPYTASLRRQFQRGVAAWIADLFYHRPRVRAGRAYWSISPALGRQPRHTAGGIPIGFDEDAAYLGRCERFALRRLLVAPSEAARQSDLSAFRFATLGSLLAAEDIALISVWSPTFLTALLALLAESVTPARDALALAGAAGADAGRMRRLQTIWDSSAAFPEKLRQTWPNLALISCWTEAAAGQFVPELRRLFPDVEIQPKGLLATEGFVSLPLVGQPAAALALRCHFFEFEELDGSRIIQAHEVDRGGRYRVLLTTGGGLYRYQLRDEVEIISFHHHCPLLRFVGKTELISDLVGEKLAEQHVRAVLQNLRALAGRTPSFQMLVPVLANPPRYRLYLQGIAGAVDQIDLKTEIQRGLEENPYYRQAVALGQLAPAELAFLDGRAGSAWLVYEARCLERGQKCGDIKPTALDRWTGWPERFAPLLRAPGRVDSCEDLPPRAVGQAAPIT